ncbi:TOBE domain-containing protein [Shewanella kaireitica]|uniref:TOBE domain-containing protein n=1 Tax=Shewanella kaireitica TaxID=212021 RepID=UPI00200EC034|nr:TOBE domain-containing protein [Shewanella kaireitica]MCL1096098.1 TOBE domain-containing protein [Shewanella kaireitica]
MNKILTALLFTLALTGCANNDVARVTKGEILANQMTKADNEGGGAAVGQLAGLAASDSDTRLSSWIIGGLVGHVIEEATLGQVSELVIRLDNGQVVSVKLDIYTEAFKQGDKVDVSINKYGKPIDIKPLTVSNHAAKTSEKGLHQHDTAQLAK